MCKPITSHNIQEAIISLKRCIDGTVYQKIKKLKDGKYLQVVFAYKKETSIDSAKSIKYNGEIYSVCGKLAINIDDLQCDYDYDWDMPTDNEGNIFDTDHIISSDLISEAKDFNDNANLIVDLYNKGKLSVY